MANRTMDILSALVLGVLAIFMYLVARGITPRFKTGVDSGFFPEIVSALLLILALAIGIRALRRGVDPDAPPQKGGGLRVWVTCALMAGAIFAMQIVGFLITAAVFLFAQMVLLTPDGQHRYVLKAILSVVFAVTVYLIFSKGFGLILPSGMF